MTKSIQIVDKNFKVLLNRRVNAIVFASKYSYEAPLYYKYSKFSVITTEFCTRVHTVSLMSATAAGSSATNTGMLAIQPKSSQQRVAVGGALTAVIMALVHVMLTLPVGCLSLSFYLCLRSGASPALLTAIYRANHAAISWMSVGTLADFFIYYCRIRAFRKALSSSFRFLTGH